MKTGNTAPKCSPLGRILMITAGGLLVIDSLFVMTRSNMNLGVILPAVIGLPLLVIGLLLPFFKRLCKRYRIIKALAFMLSLGYAALALLLCVTTALILVNSGEPAEEADALIVLGGGIRGNTPTLTLKYRLDRAADYLEKHPDCIAVVSGGQGGDEIVTEASVMRSYLISHGVGEDRILSEEASKSTEENFMFSKALIESEKGADARTVFVTTGFHVYRAERVARKLGIEAQGIPAKGVWYLTLNDYMREGLALAAYFVTGKI